MSSRLTISARFAREVTRACLPHIVLVLVRKRIITAKLLDDPERLVALLLKNLRTGTREMEFCTAIDGSFLKESIECWRRGERFIGLVLYATAVEQYLNQMYQLTLMAQGWEKRHITSLLREVNTDAKLGWMFEAFTKRPFPPRLAKRLRAVFSIRNAIVHFKGETGHPDRDGDSYDKVDTLMRGLYRISISRDFRLLDEVFIEALLSVDPDRELVFRVLDTIDAQRNDKK